MKRIISITGILILLMMLLVGCGEQTADADNQIEFEGKEYVCLEYPTDVFYYDYNGSSHDDFEEVDGTYAIDSPNWNMVWSGGDLYCIKDCADEANGYYADDSNYSFYVMIDTEEEGNLHPVEMTAAELEAVYAVEDNEKDLAVYFDDFEKQGSILKISKDGIVRGTISIGKYNGHWYWRSEIIDDSQQRDGTWPEYVQPLPASLDSKIQEAE